MQSPCANCYFLCEASAALSNSEDDDDDDVVPQENDIELISIDNEQLTTNQERTKDIKHFFSDPYTQGSKRLRNCRLCTCVHSSLVDVIHYLTLTLGNRTVESHALLCRIRALSDDIWQVSIRYVYVLYVVYLIP